MSRLLFKHPRFQVIGDTLGRGLQFGLDVLERCGDEIKALGAENELVQRYEDTDGSP